MKIVQPLQGWIRQATAGLPPSAAEKFSAEIADHFAESRRKHLAERLPSDDADRAALADLGDPAQVARTFRDAHFSRREYGRAVIAAAVVLGISLVSYALGVASNTIDYVHETNMVHVWLAGWSIFARLVGAILLLAVLRSAITLLREQYDVHTPRWGWMALAIGLGLSYLPSGLKAAISWVDIYGTFSWMPVRLIAPEWALGMTPYLNQLSQFGQVVTGMLIAGFCLVRMRRGAVLLMIPGALAGAQMIFSGVSNLIDRMPYWMARTQSLLELWLSVPGYAAWALTGLSASIPAYLLLVVLIGLFAHMRRSGAVLAR